MNKPVDDNDTLVVVPSTKIVSSETAVVEQALVKQLDIRLALWGALCQFTNVLLRTNMPNAYTTGMNIDLNLTASNYNWGFSIFFISYSMLQVPSNMIISRVSPSWFLPSTAATAGILTVLMVFARDYRDLYALRFCMGIFQAGFYPGIIYLLGTWYTPKELSRRVAMVSVGTQLSGAANGLLGGAIATALDGIAGMRGWKWLFLIEGIMTFVVGLSGYLILPNYPDSTPWLSNQQRELALSRTKPSSDLVRKSYSIQTWKNIFVTPYLYLFTVIISCITFANNMVTYLAIILNRLGFPVSEANYASAFVYAFNAVPILLLGSVGGYCSAKEIPVFWAMTWSAFWNLLVALVNGGHSPASVTISASLMITVANAVAPIIFAWANDIFSCDDGARAIVIAIMNSCANLFTNMLNPFAWDVADAPDFYIGKLSCFAACMLAAGVPFIVRICLRYNFTLQDPREEREHDELMRTNAVNYKTF